MAELDVGMIDCFFALSVDLNLLDDAIISIISQDTTLNDHLFTILLVTAKSFIIKLFGLGTHSSKLCNLSLKQSIVRIDNEEELWL